MRETDHDRAHKHPEEGCKYGRVSKRKQHHGEECGDACMEDGEAALLESDDGKVRRS